MLMLIWVKFKKKPRELEICDIPSILEYDAFIFFYTSTWPALHCLGNWNLKWIILSDI